MGQWREKIKVFVQSAVLRCHEEYDPEHAKHIHGNLCACIACIVAVATKLVAEARAELQQQVNQLRDRQLDLDGVDCGKCIEHEATIHKLKRAMKSLKADLHNSVDDRAQIVQRAEAAERALEGAKELAARYAQDRREATDKLAEAEAERRVAEAERCIKSIATMLGWGNVPPQATLEASISALKQLAALPRAKGE